MTAEPAGHVRTCWLCGCRLASDRRRKLVCVCDPCRYSRRNYDPRHHREFRDELCSLFLAHPGTRIYPLYALGIALRFKDAVRHEIDLLRREMRIVGTPYTGGYTYVPAKSCPPGNGEQSSIGA